LREENTRYGVFLMVRRWGHAIQ